LQVVIYLASQQNMRSRGHVFEITGATGMPKCRSFFVRQKGVGSPLLGQSAETFAASDKKGIAKKACRMPVKNKKGGTAYVQIYRKSE